MNFLNAGQFSAQVFLQCIPHLLFCPSLIFAGLAYINYRNQILGTLENAEEFCSGAPWRTRNVCMEMGSSVSHLGPHVSLMPKCCHHISAIIQVCNFFSDPVAHA